MSSDPTDLGWFEADRSIGLKLIGGNFLFGVFEFLKFEILVAEVGSIGAAPSEHQPMPL